MDQELKQYLRFFIEYRQKDWPEWLAVVEFAVNNKVHTVTKVLPFMTNYGKELRMGENIRRKEKVESATEFVERIKKVHEEAEAALKKTQEKMKRYGDKSRKKIEKWKKGDRVLLSTKNLVFKERPARKLMERYKVYRAVCDRGGNIIECGKITITKFNENSSSSKCKLDSLIQEASEGTEEGGRKISGS